MLVLVTLLVWQLTLLEIFILLTSKIILLECLIQYVFQLFRQIIQFAVQMELVLAQINVHVKQGGMVTLVNILFVMAILKMMLQMCVMDMDLVMHPEYVSVAVVMLALGANSQFVMAILKMIQLMCVVGTDLVIHLEFVVVIMVGQDHYATNHCVRRHV